MIGSVQPANGQGQWSTKSAGQKDADQLRAQRQATENQILLMKSASDAPTEELASKLEEKRDAIGQALRAAENTPAATGPSALERLKGQRDTYVPQEAQPSAGLYDVEAQEEGGYGVKYRPYRRAKMKPARAPR